ncbi:sugar porter family MFS transporter [Mycobacterium sp.]|uniref:sugar porter family MFS transporter n=1 Tax=Mycobacterium sp. TaxID=1785 RepID=UPI0025D8E734|nr:sugar porter family MFS transporter [Mycobacterium sp.]
MSRTGQRSRSHRGLLVGLTAASIGLISGYDVASIGGALLFITDAFGLTAPDQELVTTALAVGDIAGALSAGALANAIGRRKSLMLVAASYAVFAVLGATSGSLSVLVLARLSAGVAIGVSYVVVPVFVAESAPARVRGGLLVSYQATNVIGMIVGYLTAYLLGGPQSWRWVLGLAAVPAVVVWVLLRRVGDTARWYLLKGRVGEARQALQRGHADVDDELAGIRKALDEERTGVSAVAEMMRRPYRRATVFVVVLGFLVQITGINAIISYGPLLLGSMGLRGNFSLLVLPALVQVFALAAVLVSLVLVDRLGRRPVLLSGIATMVVANLALVVSFAHGGNSGGGWPAAFGVFGVLLFVCGFNVGFGPLACVYAGESLPARLRSIGSAAMHTSNLVANAIVAAFFLTLLSSLGGVATFTVLGVLAQIGFVYVHRYAPETKGSQLERIRHVWAAGGPDDRVRVAEAPHRVALTG